MNSTKHTWTKHHVTVWSYLIRCEVSTTYLKTLSKGLYQNTVHWYLAKRLYVNSKSIKKALPSVFNSLGRPSQFLDFLRTDLASFSNSHAVKETRLGMRLIQALHLLLLHARNFWQTLHNYYHPWTIYSVQCKPKAKNCLIERHFSL